MMSWRSATGFASYEKVKRTLALQVLYQRPSCQRRCQELSGIVAKALPLGGRRAARRRTDSSSAAHPKRPSTAASLTKAQIEERTIVSCRLKDPNSLLDGDLGVLFVRRRTDRRQDSQVDALLPSTRTDQRSTFRQPLYVSAVYSLGGSDD